MSKAAEMAKVSARGGFHLFWGLAVNARDSGTVQGCQVDHYKNSLTLVAVMSELNGTKMIEWNILTTYESYSGDQLTTSASDIAPDEGLQQTVLGT